MSFAPRSSPRPRANPRHTVTAVGGTPRSRSDNRRTRARPQPKPQAKPPVVPQRGKDLQTLRPWVTIARALGLRALPGALLFAPSRTADPKLDEYPYPGDLRTGDYTPPVGKPVVLPPRAEPQIAEPSSPEVPTDPLPPVPVDLPFDVPEISEPVAPPLENPIRRVVTDVRVKPNGDGEIWIRPGQAPQREWPVIVPISPREQERVVERPTDLPAPLPYRDSDPAPHGLPEPRRQRRRTNRPAETVRRKGETTEKVIQIEEHGPDIRLRVRTRTARSGRNRRRRDGKYNTVIGQVMEAIDMTFGTYTEVMDFAEAVAWNIYGQNVAGENALAMTLENGSYVGVMKGVLDGRYDLDPIGAMTDYAAAQSQDKFIGRLSKAQQQTFNELGWESPIGWEGYTFADDLGAQYDKEAGLT